MRWYKFNALFEMTWVEIMFIRYENSKDAWSGIVPFITSLIKDSSSQRVLEVGAGANPTFSMEFVKNNNLHYTLLDISAEELEKAPVGYRTIQADIASSPLNLEGKYDFIFTRMLAEHIRDGEAFHRNIYSLLTPGGIAFHFFPTLYAPPFVVNRLLPERMARYVLNLFQAGRDQEGKHAKFPAYYSWCRGPLGRQIERFENIGFEIREYIGFFGHSGYYKKIPFAEKIHHHLVEWLIKHPIPSLTSFAYIVLVAPPAK